MPCQVPEDELITLRREDVYLEMLIQRTNDAAAREWLRGIQRRLMLRIRNAQRASAGDPFGAAPSFARI